MSEGHVVFVTGRLAEASLRRVLADAPPPFPWDVAVMKITVAALMTTEWIGRFLRVAPETTRVVVPGLCEGDTAPLATRLGVPVEKGPTDLRELPATWGARDATQTYGAWDIDIVAEINDVAHLDLDEVRRRARALRADGADVIDLGCAPGVTFPGLAGVVRDLVGAGHHVSIDTFDPHQIRLAVDHGARLVLSVNGSNLAVARDLAGSGARVVVVPDSEGGLASLDPSISALDAWGVPYLLDPILAPIGHGFMASLERYAEVRRRYPTAEMLMGIGNVTELTAVDSTGVNAVLTAVCQELGVRTVLTTEVATWTQGAVRELDIARRLMHYAVIGRTFPKGVDNRLLTSRDARQLTFSEAELRTLQAQITDPYFRIFVDATAITVLNHERFVQGTDEDHIFAQLGVTDPSHACYLGAELARAKIALLLGKTYRQDEGLEWGYLTPPAGPRRHVRLSAQTPDGDRERP